MIRRAATMMLAVLMPGAAWARRGPDVLETIAALPASADVVVVLDRGAEQHASDAGRALERAWTGLGDFAGTEEAWRELAEVLDLPPDQAFDELLGRRCTLVIDRSWGEPRWAVLTEVDPAIERRLLQRLRPATRQTEDGLPLLALEQGRFELATSRRSVPGRIRGPGQMGLCTVLIAPATSSELFDELTPLLRGSESALPLRSDAQFQAARGIGAGDAVLFYRSGEDEFVACALKPAGNGWEGSVRASGTAAGAVREDGMRWWEPPNFDELGPRAAVAMVGRLPSVTALAWRLLPCRLARLRDAEQESLGAREAVVVMVNGSGEAEVTVAREARDIGLLAPQADLEMAGLLGGSDQAHVPAPEYLGSMPSAVRRVRMEGDSSVAWAFLSCNGANAGPGWWVTHASDDGEGAGAGVRRVGTLLCMADRKPGRRLTLSAGTVRPALLLEALEAGGLVDGALSGLSAMGSFDRVKWEAWVMEDGVVEGRISVRMK